MYYDTQPMKKLRLEKGERKKKWREYKKSVNMRYK